MAIVRGRSNQEHSSVRNMFPSNEEAGKGLYIGGDDSPPTYHQRHHHHQTSTMFSPPGADSRKLQTMKNAGSGNEGGGGGGDGELSSDSIYHRELPISDTAEYLSGQHLPLVGPSPSPSASSSSPTSLYSNIHPQGGESPYKEPLVSQSDPSLLRHNITLHNSAYNSIQRHAHSNNYQSSPYPQLIDHSNFINLGADQAPSANPLRDHFYMQSLDPMSPTLESPWNFSDTRCYNRTTGNYECWDIFNPDENMTTTQSLLASEDDFRFWTLVLLIIPILTVFGNVLVVLSVLKEKSLKTVTNYFICSLAVADIMVAVTVMPFAVYMEVMNNRWMLTDGLCDAWVASDVLGCTASILNLTAICVDRFIAVTQPIKYAKHKNSKRVFIMLAITWVISVAIAAPIALGVNYSEHRKPGDCHFFNSDFIIYSSMGSFYIPSMIMCFLYWKIYRVIRMRALKAKKAKELRDVDRRALQGVIENPATVATQNTNDTGGVYGAEATVTTGLAKMDNGRVTTYNTTKATTSRMLAADHGDDNSVTNVNSNSDDNSNDEDESPSGSGSANNNTTGKDNKKKGLSNVTAQVNPKLLRNAETAELITNPVAEEMERLENEEQQAMLQFGKNGGCTTGPEGSASTSGAAQTCAHEAETPFTSVVCKGDTSDNSEEKDGSSPKKKGGSSKRGQKKAVTKFNFHMRTSRKRKEKSSSRREKKATKTLAIVLGVFLVCWVPFFTLNIINAICIRYDLKDFKACQVDLIFISLFQWLGYINSFLNPVIYTIFNQEFRKAFRKLLMEPCR